jgi:hypothetical protein
MLVGWNSEAFRRPEWVVEDTREGVVDAAIEGVVEGVVEGVNCMDGVESDEEVEDESWGAPGEATVEELDGVRRVREPPFGVTVRISLRPRVMARTPVAPGIRQLL